MSELNAREVLEKVSSGDMDIDKAERLLKLDYVEKIGNHTVFDMSRECRNGIPEVIYAESKTPAKVADIVERVIAHKGILVLSRASDEHHSAIVKRIGKKGVVYRADAAHDHRRQA